MHANMCTSGNYWLMIGFIIYFYMHRCIDVANILDLKKSFVDFMEFWRLCVFYYYKSGKDWIRRTMRHFSRWNCLLLQSLCHSHHHVPNCIFFPSTCLSTPPPPLFATGKRSQMSFFHRAIFTPHLTAKWACFLIIWRYLKQNFIVQTCCY